MKKIVSALLFCLFVSEGSAQRSTLFKNKKELHAYLISKLVWSPDIKIENTKNDLLKEYFEQAAPYIKKIIDTIEYTLVRSRKPLLLYESPFAHRDDYLSPFMIKYYHEQIAIAIVETLRNSKILKRVDKFAQTFRFADIEIAKAMINTDNWIFEKRNDTTLVLKTYYDSLLTEFSDKSKVFGNPVLYQISSIPGVYETRTRHFLNTAIEKHLAVGAKISFKELYNSQYKANGLHSLIDGIHGFDKWEVLWQGWLGKDLAATIDLGSSKQIHQVKMNFMDDNRNLILAPASLKVEISNDGKNFTQAGVILNSNAGAKFEKQIVLLELNLSNPVQARFLKVTVKNIGKLPKWRGVAGDSWLFTDEIVLK